MHSEKFSEWIKRAQMSHNHDDGEKKQFSGICALNNFQMHLVFY